MIEMRSREQYELLGSSDDRPSSHDNEDYKHYDPELPSPQQDPPFPVLPAQASRRSQKRLVTLFCLVSLAGLLVYTVGRRFHSAGTHKNGNGSAMFNAMDRHTQIGPALASDVQEDLGLPADTCRREFPLFYPQLQDNELAWKRGQKDEGQGSSLIQAAQITAAYRACEGGCAHILIDNNGQIFLRALRHDWQSRVRAVLQLLQKALEAAPLTERQALDGTEFVFSTADKDGFAGNAGDGAGWVLDKRVADAGGQYLIPDFSFAGWPEAGVASYGEFRRDARRIEQLVPWQSKQDKIFFRGDPTVGGRRASLLAQLRKPASSEWSDVKRTSFWETGPDISPIVSPPDHCRHKFLLHSEGNSYSGRSKFILGCASAVIIHELEWTQHFHPAIITNETSPDRNAILPPGQLFDHLDTLAHSLQAEEAAAVLQQKPVRHWDDLTRGHKVALNANRTLANRYLSPAATACYFRAALQSYSSLLDRASWPKQNGPQLRLGGGIKPGAGAGNFSGPTGLKLLHLEDQGDIHYDSWNLLGQPQWPPG